MGIGKPTNLISKVLSPALRLWLRSQVESADELQIQIQGQDRQILRGYIPRVSLSSSQAIYQGLRLGKVQLRGENIRINIGQVIKGKPLQLLEPLQVTGEISLEQADLQASLSSSLLASAFRDLLVMFLEESGMESPRQQLASYQVSWQDVTLKREQFAVRGTLVDGQETTTSVAIRVSLSLINPQTLRLSPLEMEGWPELDSQWRELAVDLGTDVAIEQFSLDEGQLSCCGRLKIYN